MAHFGLLLPLLLGILLGARTASTALAWPAAVTVYAMLWCMQAALHFFNDAADAELDEKNNTYSTLPGIIVSGGSRVIQLGLVWASLPLYTTCR
jgi:4-hydroxybenzoate polyprenyltransferase